MERQDFIYYTNTIEGRGYEIDKEFVKGGCIGKYRYNGGEWVYGKILYKTQLECQKGTATAIFNKISSTN